MSAPRTLSEARWSCAGCGQCCHGFDFGPVSDAVISGLEEASIADSWAPAAEAPWRERRRGPDGSDAWYLTHRDGHCVFLQDDARCAIHRVLGAEAKPAFCREYPLLVTRAADGPAVTVRADCGGLHETFETGTPVAEQAEAAAALPRVAPALEWSPDHVVLLPGVAVGPSSWVALEPRLLARVAEETRPPEGHAATLRASLHRVLDRTDPGPQPEQVAQILPQMLGFLRRSLDEVAPYLPEHARPAHGQATEIVERALAADGPPPLTEPAQRYLATILRSHLLARRLGAGVPATVGALLLHFQVARRAVGGVEAQSPGDIGPVLAPWLRAVQASGLHPATRRLQPGLEALFMMAG